jgi:hypothetical protein
VRLLTSPCDATQRHAALGLANLALKEANREAIAAAGAVALLIELTSRGATTQARAEAVAALANLAMDGAFRAILPGVAPPALARTPPSSFVLQARLR